MSIDKPTCLAACTLLLLQCGNAYASPIMQPGGWEMKVTVAVLDRDSGEYRVFSQTTMKNCISREFLARDPYLTARVDEAKMQQRGAKCDIFDYTRDETSASWGMKCDLADGTRFRATVRNTAAPLQLISEMRQVVEKDGTVGEIKTELTGIFVGECTKDMLPL